MKCDSFAIIITVYVLSMYQLAHAAAVKEQFCLVPRAFVLPHYVKPIDDLYDNFNSFCSKYIYTDHSEKTVNLGQGEVIGNYWKHTREFLGIPYALPPTGQWRWKPPQPLPAYTERITFDARHFGHHCHQMSSNVDGGSPQFLVGLKSEPSEDCLNLNVFTPRTEHLSAKGLPVIIFIHGGSFTTGGTSMGIYNPSEMVAKHKNIVVVTINYRLGVLGFMASDDLKAEGMEEGFGNYGLLDQLMAIKWVHENIASFGGDPNRITLMGHSAGSISINYILHITKLEKYRAYRKMFHRVVMLSGTILAWPQRHLGDEFSQDSYNILKKHFNCHTYDDVLECMRTVSPVDLSQYATEQNWEAIWGPVRDDVLIKEAPDVLAKSEVGNDICMIITSGKDDGTLFVKPIPHSPHDTKKQLSSAIDDSRELSRVCNQYPSHDFKDEFYRVAAIIRDAFFRCPAAELTSFLHHAGTNAYYFQFSQPIAFLDIATKVLKGHAYGVFHGSELIYMFEFNKGILLPSERRRAHDYQSRLIAFATHGNPNVFGKSRKLMTNPMKMGANRDCAFWHTVGSFHIPLPKIDKNAE